jgi:hypothetical protein
MISEAALQSTINELNQDRKATFAEFIYKIYGGKFIEIYLGDSYEEISTEQVSTPYAAVFSGRVVGAYKECLILEAAYIDRHTKKHKLGNTMLINERAIRALSEVDGNGLLGDMFLRSREALELKETFEEKPEK